ncbi:MAG TPA: hypothetical protein VG818_11070, partial [Gemmatimonadaceae bacterium]|nr:hypothetical protein [Gemmatimonadaceae bacterium]
MALLCAASRDACAQAGLDHLDDATVVPKGLLRLDAMSAWTRYDSRFAPPGSPKSTLPLGAPFSSDSFNLTTYPLLGAAQGAITQMAGAPFRLSMGAVRSVADARVVTTPLAAEYGLTRRITIGAMIPLVRTRTTLFVRANPAGNEGNVGPNPAMVNASALRQDSLVAAQLSGAAQALQQALAACQSNPNANANCGTLLARPSDVTALVQQANTFATSVALVYGSSGTGVRSPVVPIASSSTDAAIRQRLVQLDSSFRAFLNGGPMITASPVAAAGEAGVSDIENIVHSVTGIDSLRNFDHIGIGDIELSAKVLLVDQFTDSEPHGLATRATFTGTYRLATGQGPTPTNPLDIGTGNGTAQLEGRVATYSQFGRHFGLGATAQLTHSLKSAPGPSPIPADLPFGVPYIPKYTPAAPSSWEITVAPRLQVTPALGAYLAWGLQHFDASSTAMPSLPFTTALLGGPGAYHDGIYSAAGNTRTIGFGVTYSTLLAFERGAKQLPVDIGFTHLEASAGQAMMPKFFRDQIVVRLYARVRKAG